MVYPKFMPRRVPVPLPSMLPLPRRQLGLLLLPFAIVSIVIAWYINDGLNSEIDSHNLDIPFDARSHQGLAGWLPLGFVIALWALIFTALFARQPRH